MPFVWKQVLQRTLAESLDKMLPQANPKLTVSTNKATWANVAPRTQNVVHLILSDSGIHLQASPTNTNCMEQLQTLLKERVNGSDEFFLTPIRSHLTGVQVFVVKPMPWLKKKQETHVDALYGALKLVIEELQPFI